MFIYLMDFVNLKIHHDPCLFCLFADRQSVQWKQKNVGDCTRPKRSEIKVTSFGEAFRHVYVGHKRDMNIKLHRFSTPTLGP
jgi:hypothetical protein